MCPVAVLWVLGASGAAPDRGRRSRWRCRGARRLVETQRPGAAGLYGAGCMATAALLPVSSGGNALEEAGTRVD
ncbi:hypothetical protein E2562_019592 [Oryza meyeriana var. granulata]|uniref:Uncharacterized protein n=1 Tax=Oryza meyeriana var. granulata TaxID=110450 RepID=A0A6G1EX95_9ORYZ|nr:hypothetical protein E2562_019592 [Oryza meyeriana var. granulata]